MSRAMTLTEKILAKAGGVQEVKPGDIVNAKISLVYTMDFLGKVLYSHLEELGVGKVFDPEKVVVVFDHQAPAPNVQWAELQKWIRSAVRRYGGILYDIGRHGIMHQMVVEEGHILPGTVAIGTDSHAPTGGALGAVVMGIGATDAAVAMATGELWLLVPESVKVHLEGKLPLGVMSRDVTSLILGKKGWDGGRAEWVYKAVEFTGPTVKEMDMSSRLAATNLTSDMGVKNGIIVADQKTVEFMEERTNKPYELLKSDPNAEYSEELSLDVSDLEPQVACPHSPDNVKSITEVEGTRIDQAVIASCINARLEDLKIAAEILNGRRIHKDVRMIVSPATSKTYRRAMQEGILQVFVDAGAHVGQSTCGPCFGGQFGVLASGEVCISTTPRNMEGRMGSPQSQVFTANPATVAASAVNGVITDPRRMLRR